jgi:hypothetical protein
MWQVHRVRVAVVVVVVVVVVACGGSTVRSGGASGMGGERADASGVNDADVDRDIARVRAATDAFRSIDGAAAAGYAPVVRQCIAHPEHGAMGFHHTNRALLDDRIEVERPEILVYERTEAGEYVLNGVEYIVPYSARSRDAEPPAVMGQALKRSDELELWYLHVWVWKENRAGLFADWNPAVECRS